MSYIPEYPFGGGLPNDEKEILHDPHFLSWTSEEVGDWIEVSGYPMYRDCFVSNFITGRKLIKIDASALPKMGITDFEHIKEEITKEWRAIVDIAKLIRDLLEIERSAWDRSISLPPREKLAAFLERKSKTGEKTDSLKYLDFCEDYERIHFSPPLENEGLIIQSCKIEPCGSVVYIQQPDSSESPDND